MSCPAVALEARPLARTHALSPRVSFYLLASITTSFLAGSSAPTPLYPIYQQLWHFSPVTVTVIFAAYALALLAMLLVGWTLVQLALALLLGWWAPLAVALAAWPLTGKGVASPEAASLVVYEGLEVVCSRVVRRFVEGRGVAAASSRPARCRPRQGAGPIGHRRLGRAACDLAGADVISPAVARRPSRGSP